MGSINLGGVEGTWVRYWDEASTVAQLEFKVEEPIQAQTAIHTKDEKKKKKAKGTAAANLGRAALTSSQAMTSRRRNQQKLLNFRCRTNRSPSASRAALVRSLVSRPFPLVLSSDPRPLHSVSRWQMTKEARTRMRTASRTKRKTPRVGLMS